MELLPKAFPALCTGVDDCDAANGVADACCCLPNKEEVAALPNAVDVPWGPLGVLEVAGVPKGVGVLD